MTRKTPRQNPDPWGRHPPQGYPGDYPPPPPDRPRASWHIEKGISLSLLIFLVIQTASIVWFAAGISGQVKQNTSDIAEMRAEEKEREKQRAEVIANLSSINQELRDMREIMFQSAGRATQLVMPQAANGAPPQIIMQQAPAAPIDGVKSQQEQR